jgi:hypothetical protein
MSTALPQNYAARASLRRARQFRPVPGDRCKVACKHHRKNAAQQTAPTDARCAHKTVAESGLEMFISSGAACATPHGQSHRLARPGFWRSPSWRSRTQPVTVQKFANRQLHDPARGIDVTLEELAAMLDAGEDFSVQDAGADLTRAVRAQIAFLRDNESPVMALRRGT